MPRCVCQVVYYGMQNDVASPGLASAIGVLRSSGYQACAQSIAAVYVSCLSRSGNRKVSKDPLPAPVVIAQRVG